LRRCWPILADPDRAEQIDWIGEEFDLELANTVLAARQASLLPISERE
jgi:hypothetical protein